MGLFDKFVKDAVDKVSSEVKKAAEREVDKAVDKAAEDAAEKVVEKASDEFSEQMDKEMDEAKRSLEEADAAFSEAGKAFSEISEEDKATMRALLGGSGETTPQIESIKADLAKANEELSKISDEDWKRADAVLSGMMEKKLAKTKYCIECGDVVESAGETCPKCGSKLPDKNMLECITCPKCGSKCSMEARECSQCGEKLPWVVLEEMHSARMDEKTLDSWESILPQFPRWNGGGSDFELEARDEDYGDEGRDLALFSAIAPSKEQALRKYTELLRQNGFVNPYGDDGWDETLCKVIDGTCYVFCQANMDRGSDDDSFYVSFAIRNDYIKKLEDLEKKRNAPKEPPKQKPKGLFGGLFG